MWLISDENGPYYWHIKSGTIQREAPVASPVDVHSGEDAAVSAVTSSVGVLNVFVLILIQLLNAVDQSNLAEVC